MLFRPPGAFALEQDAISLEFGQAKRIENSNSFDILNFPSYVQFPSIKAKWANPASDNPALELRVTASVVSDSPENTTVKSLSADYTTPEEKTWRRTEFEKDPESGEWVAKISFTGWKASGASGPVSATTTATTTATAPVPATAPTAATAPVAPEMPAAPRIESNTAGVMDDSGKGLKWESTLPPPSTGADDQRVVVCLRAVDSLGNSTVELYRQMRPQEVSEIHFTPLIVDAAEPGRQKNAKNYENTPDRDLLTTSAAWLDRYIYFLARVAGNTSPGIAVDPGYNYFILRLTGLDTSALFCKLGKGVYHYHATFNRLEEVLPGKKDKEYPFGMDFDSRMLLEFAVMLEYGKQHEQLPPVFDDYVALLEEVGMFEALDENRPVPSRVVLEGADISATHFMDRVYWKMDPTVLAQDGLLPTGFYTRFYSGYMHTRDDSNVMRDDRTGYSAVFLRHHLIERGKDAQFEISERDIPAPPARPKIMQNLIDIMESRGIDTGY